MDFLQAANVIFLQSII